jgi:hypothetical protein
MDKSLLELIQIIKNSKKDKQLIIKEFKILQTFYKENPWVLKEDAKRQIGEYSFEQLEKALQFQEIYLLDDLSKVYKQIKILNSFTLLRAPVFFYSVNKNLFSQQLQEGFKIGDIDNKNFVVSGSNLVLEALDLKILEFLNFYFSINN